uniref:T-complex protein 1 subunit beta n=1 Tax=Canis lupus familiaris TaxID=9615 RepID=A0A8C0PFJ5_CANLF
MPSLSLSPVNIFKAGADEDRVEMARLSSFIRAIAIGDLVKSTLGPKDASLMVTNDGATILKNIGVDNPAAKVLVDMSRVQDDEVGDGTTSVTGSLGGAAVWRLPLAQGVIPETRDQILHWAPGA